MKNLQAHLPDISFKEVEELAEKQNASVDQIVSLALAAHVSAFRTRESIESRANRVNLQKVDKILARVPDVTHLNPAMNCEYEESESTFLRT